MKTVKKKLAEEKKKAKKDADREKSDKEKMKSMKFGQRVAFVSRKRQKKADKEKEQEAPDPPAEPPAGHCTYGFFCLWPSVREARCLS